MRPEETVLIIGGKLKIPQKAKALGLAVVYFQLIDGFGPEHRDLVDCAVLVDYTNPAQLLPLAKAAHEAWGFASVLSLTEPGLVPAARVNDMLGLRGTPEKVAQRFMNKWTMRQRLTATGCQSVPAALVKDPESMATFGHLNGYPFIVKPTNVTSSLGVRRITSATDIEPAWQYMEDLRVAKDLLWTRYFQVNEFIMEAYVTGPEYSVESFSFNGRHIVVAITEKAMYDGTFVEVGHAMPARLPDTTEQSIVQATTDFLDAMELRDGPAHTEIKLGADGPVVVESHNRVGGDRINELVQSAYDIDLDTYAIGWPFGLVPELTSRPSPKRAAATRFVLAEPGTVTVIHGLEEVRAHPDMVALDLNVRVGHAVPPLTDNWGRIGQIVASGANTAAAIETCEQLIKQTTITTIREP